MTTGAIVVALAMAGGFGPVAASCARRLPPRHATWTISAGAVVSALCSLAVLGVLVVALLGELPPFAAEGHWSGAALRHHELTEPGVAVVAGALLIVAVGALALAAGRLATTLVAAYRSCAEMPAGAGGLVVVRDGPVEAAAVPGRPGRVVVAESLLVALTAPERRALLAHERSHLSRGHHWHRGAVTLAAAANPLLAPLRPAIVYATERWADEDAAAEVGDRRQVAAALAHAALMAGPAAAGARLALAAQAVPARVAALLARPPRTRPLLLLGLAAIPLVGALAVLVLLEQADRVFDLAAQVYAVSHAA
jgi:Zn-dependent protease with chaperone function